jgi:hypothetical protein
VEGAIDCGVNVDNGEAPAPEWPVRVEEDHFRGGDEFPASLSAEQSLAAMDEAGVARAIVNVGAFDRLDRAAS